MEDALGIRVGGALRDLRRLLYFGEWIESHTLHVVSAARPGFPRLPGRAHHGQDARRLGQEGPSHQAGRQRRHGAARRPGDPSHQRQGGRLLPGADARRAGGACSPSCAGDERPPRRRPNGSAASPTPRSSATTSSSSLRHPDEYPFCEGRVVSSLGLDIDVHGLRTPLRRAAGAPLERAALTGGGPRRLPERTARPLQPVLRSTVAGGAGAGGPARVDAADQEPVSRPASFACWRWCRRSKSRFAIIERYQPPAAPFVDAPLRAAIGCGGTEAPRGFLFHRYELDETGTILDARIVPPTSREPARPSRKTSTRWRRSSLPSPMTARHTARSRPSAITTRASRARRTFSRSGWNADDPASRVSHSGGRAAARGR